jgi:hypothetical protein
MAAAAQPQNIELGHVRDGYPALATWMARDPDGEAYIFRKFTRLSARNLLHLQSQLTELEHEIDTLDEAARTSVDDKARQSSRRWETLLHQALQDSRPERQKYEKAKELSKMI